MSNPDLLFMFDSNYSSVSPSFEIFMHDKLMLSSNAFVRVFALDFSKAFDSIDGKDGSLEATRRDLQLD